MIYYNEWHDLLASFPVAVNNFYGDPLIQWENTVSRLRTLLLQNHQGPVALITKGGFSEERIELLKSFRKQGLNLVVLVSISELTDYEKVKQEPRYHNIRLLNEARIPNVAYVRPMTPPLNTSPETIEKILNKLQQNGAKIICLAGFRGDDMLVQSMNPTEKVQWTMRVKLLTKEVYQLFRDGCERHGIKLYLRTACAVANALGLERTWNPYYNSRNLVHCEDLDCPLLLSCHSPAEPKPRSLELLTYLGFDWELQNEGCHDSCKVQGDKRLSCPSCCTTCYMLKVPRIYLKNPGLNLGTLNFVRFLTGMLTVQTGMHDDGAKDIGFVRFPNFPWIDDFVCINTWSAYAQHGERCFECSYCIERYYIGRSCNTTPLDLLKRLITVRSEAV